jgi:hypothetical protein
MATDIRGIQKPFSKLFYCRHAGLHRVASGPFLALPCASRFIPNRRGFFVYTTYVGREGRDAQLSCHGQAYLPAEASQDLAPNFSRRTISSVKPKYQSYLEEFRNLPFPGKPLPPASAPPFALPRSMPRRFGFFLIKLFVRYFGCGQPSVVEGWMWLAVGTCRCPQKRQTKFVEPATSYFAPEYCVEFHDTRTSRGK